MPAGRWVTTQPSPAACGVTTRVRNTFLHFEDDNIDQCVGEQPGLAHAKTMPLAALRPMEDDPGTDYQTRTCRVPVPTPDTDEGLVAEDECHSFHGTDPHGECSSDSESIGPQPALCWHKTFDDFDSLAVMGDEDNTRQCAMSLVQGNWQAPANPMVLPGQVPPHVLTSSGLPMHLVLAMPGAAQQAEPPGKQAAKATKQPSSKRQSGQKATTLPATTTPEACQLNRDPDALRLRWTVDARKLRKNTHIIVSPIFHLPIGREHPMPFKLLLHPKKDAGSFRASKGVGTIRLKCEATVQESPDVSLQLRFGVNKQTWRGPVLHNFAQSGICSLLEDQQEWNFISGIEQDSQTSLIFLEVLTELEGTGPSVTRAMGEGIH